MPLRKRGGRNARRSPAKPRANAAAQPSTTAYSPAPSTASTATLQASPSPAASSSQAGPEMAPVNPNPHDVVEAQIKDVLQTLYQTMVQVTTYDQAGRPSKDVLENSTKQLVDGLQKLHTTASSQKTADPRALPAIPSDLIQYVDAGRNPDIYTREFTELVRKNNQLMKGKMSAFGSFRDILAEEMLSVMPELKEDIKAVVEATGGNLKKEGKEGEDVEVKKETL